MKMIKFTDLEVLNQFLAKTDEENKEYIKSIKTVVLKDEPIFFVTIEPKRYYKQRYNPKNGFS